MIQDNMDVEGLRRLCVRKREEGESSFSGRCFIINRQSAVAVLAPSSSSSDNAQAGLELDSNDKIFNPKIENGNDGSLTDGCQNVDDGC
jgi:hypothetical protein